MALYRTVSLSFWTDPKVDDNFTPEDKYFYLYLLTNPHTNICGCYEIGKKQIERETGYTWDTVSRLIDRMQNVHEVISYDPGTKEVLILNWGKYNWSKSQSTITAVLKCAEHIKLDAFRKYVVDRVTGVDNSEQYTDTVTVSVSVTDATTGPTHTLEGASEKPKRKVFKPPTLEEVLAYCRERKNNVDAQRFIDYYSSNGWMVGKNKMKDWKAAVRTWERNNYSSPVPAKTNGPKSFEQHQYNDLDMLRIAGY